MKIDEVSLQSVLRAYGKNIKVKNDTQKEDMDAANASSSKVKPLSENDFDLVGYDVNGKLNISQEKKKALIDFFQ